MATGTAWVVHIDNHLYINNSHENSDIAQDFSIELPNIGTLSGTILPHPYVLARIEPEHIWMMGNADAKGPYTDDRTTRLQLTFDEEPTVTDGATSQWANGELDIFLEQSTGVVEAHIQLP